MKWFPKSTLKSITPTPMLRYRVHCAARAWNLKAWLHTNVNIAPKRIVTCDYCEFPLPAIDLFEHQEVCGNRTELCNLCIRYIRLRERMAHELTCNGVPDTTVEASRAREGEREHGGGAARRRPRPPPQEFSTRRLVFTIAITGIAVVLGSLMFQRKPQNTDLR